MAGCGGDIGGGCTLAGKQLHAAPPTSGGAARRVQIAFQVLYLATQAVVMASYISTKALPPWSLALLCLSRRLHSIYLLRLFNDCWAMFFAYAGILALQVSYTPPLLAAPGRRGQPSEQRA